MYRLELDVMPKAKALINAVVKGNTKYSLETKCFLMGWVKRFGIGSEKFLHYRVSLRYGV